MSKNLIITGASGQLGRQLVRHLSGHGHRITAVAGTNPGRISGACEVVSVDLAACPLPKGLATKDCTIIHLAGTVPREAERTDPSASGNVAMARNLAQVRPKRLILLSSLAASVAEKFPDTARQYGQEKLAVEAIFGDALSKEAVVTLRPPAIYGPGMSGPITQLAALVGRDLPLPLGSITTARPYVSLGNLLSLFDCLLDAGSDDWRSLTDVPLEVHDGHLVRTCDLVRHLAVAQGKQARLVPVPARLLSLAGRVAGKSELVAGALDPVPCDIDMSRLGAIGWQPVERMPDSLRFLGEGA